MLNIKNSYTYWKTECRKTGPKQIPLLRIKGSVLSYTYHSGFKKYVTACTLLEITPRAIEGQGKTKGVAHLPMT